MKRNRLCRLIGHRWDPDALDHAILECERCGVNSNDGDEGVRQPRHVAAIRRIYWTVRGEFRYGFRVGCRRLWRSFRSWLRCPCCEGRFGRHDWDRCIPFGLMLAVILVETWK